MEKTIKLFLTSGVTLTVREQDELYVYGNANATIHDLYDYIKTQMNCNEQVEFQAFMKDKDGKLFTHTYYLPHDRISWFMIEEV